MTTQLEYTQGQRVAQAKALGELFGVDPDAIASDIDLQSWGGDRVMVSIRLVKHVDKATANAILNPVETPEERA